MTSSERVRGLESSISVVAHAVALIGEVNTPDAT